MYLFSDKIVTSFLASYSITSFYVGVVLVIGSTLRPILVFATPYAYMYEANDTGAICRLCEAVHMMRHEERIDKEEEYFMMLVEILRSPELFKALCGTSIREAPKHAIQHKKVKKENSDSEDEDKNE